MARTTTRHTIVCKYGPGKVGVIQSEATGTATIYPGYLLEYSGTNVQAHSTGTGVLPGKLIALENPTPDTNTYSGTAAIDIPYASGDTIYFAYGQPGEVYNMYLAASQTATANTSQIASNGDGTVRVITVAAGHFANSVVGVADNSVTTGASTARLRVRIV